MSETIEPELEIARRLLAEKFGAKIEKAEELSTRSRARVSRLWLAEAKPPTSTTVICKYPFEKTHCANDEWSGLRFLTETAVEAETAPRFLAGDASTGLILMQDLGDMQDLGMIEDSGDHDRLREACVALARLTATMHSCAVGIEDTYTSIRQDLPMADRPVRIRQAEDFREALDSVCRHLAQAAVNLESGFHDEHEIVARAIEEPGPLLTFTHGDMAPSNCLFGKNAPFLIDFEWSGYRHALYDALFWHIIYPLPESIIGAMDSAYRRGFGPACRLAIDNAQYQCEMAKLCAHHVLSFISWWFPKILERDDLAATGITRRQMILFKLHRFVTYDRASSLPAIRATLARLARELKTAWPDVPAMPGS